MPYTLTKQEMESDGYFCVSDKSLRIQRWEIHQGAVGSRALMDELLYDTVLETLRDVPKNGYVTQDLNIMSQNADYLELMLQVFPGTGANEEIRARMTLNRYVGGPLRTGPAI